MDILNRTGRALQAFLTAYPQASAEMRRGMETSMLLLASVTRNTTYYNLHLVMKEQEEGFIAEKFYLQKEVNRLNNEVGNLKKQLAGAQRALALAQGRPAPVESVPAVAHVRMPSDRAQAHKRVQQSTRSSRPKR